MMRCDVCKGWTHLSCMRMKEVVGVVEGKELILCATFVLPRQKEVGRLRAELHSVRVELKEMKKENRRLKYEVEGWKESLRATQGKAMKSMPRGEVVVGDRLEGK